VPDASLFDIFVSYSRRDNQQGRIRELVTVIQTQHRALTGGQELRIFFDTEDIKGGDDWEHRLLGGIRSARLLLACLSPSYLESEYCAKEFIEYLKHEFSRVPLGEGIMPVYVSEIEWANTASNERTSEWVPELRRRQYFDLRSWFDKGAETFEDSTVKARLEDLKNQIRNRLERASRVIDAKGNVDRHNEQFVGRRRELQQLRQVMSLGKVGVLTVIHGLGGIGKTALATEYSYLFAPDYPGGRWQVRCEGKKDLRAVFVSLAGVRDLEFEFTEEEKHDLDLQFERVLRELKKRADAVKGRVLIVLDNVDQAKLLEPAHVQQLPQADWLHSIATTRLGGQNLFSTQKDRAFVAVDELPEQDAIALIERYQPNGKFAVQAERRAAEEIVRLLGGFTLAVETAAVFLGQFAEDVSCAAFLDRLRKEGLVGLETAAGETSEGVRHGEKLLTATLRPTLERLSDAERLALLIGAILPADHVALPWVRVAVAGKFPELGKDAEPGHPDPWQTLLRHLYSLRLFQATSERSEARMHRLLQNIIKLHVGAEPVETYERELLLHVNKRGMFLSDHWVEHEYRWELAPLVACAWQWIERGADEEGAYLATLVANPLISLAKFAEAEPLFRRALAIREKALGPEHPEVAASLSCLAALYYLQGRYEEAAPLWERTLRIHEQGPEHPDMAWSLNNLALLYDKQGRYAKAEPLYERSLAIREKAMGPEHPKVATSLYNLAGLYYKRGQYAKAEPLYERSLAIREKALGPEHPDVAWSLNDLAALYDRQDQYAKAEPLYERSLAIREKALGPEHPDVAWSLNGLAALYDHQGQYAKAEPLYERSLAIFEKALGPKHADVAYILTNFAKLYHNQGQYAKAESLYERSLAILEKALGPEHPDVATSLGNFGMLYLDQGQYAKAEPLLERSLAIREKALGPEHPNVAISLYSLGRLYHKQGQYAKAESLYERSLAIREKALGPEHPDVANTLYNLAGLYHVQRQYAKAEPLYERSLAIQEKALGPEHPDVATWMISYGQLLVRMWRWKKAARLIFRAVDIREKLKNA
jgi:tetratricopeptide (TPR) repeat protein